EKQKYEEFFHSITMMDDALTANAFIGKYKKNGGFVATVFINNGFSIPLSLENVYIEIFDSMNEKISAGEFHIHLQINAFSSLPWSFVFSKDQVLQKKDEIDLFHVNITYNE